MYLNRMSGTDSEFQGSVIWGNFQTIKILLQQHQINLGILCQESGNHAWIAIYR